MEEKTFYDIHMHAFNLSHPDFSAFIRRFKVDVIKMQLMMTIAGIIPLLMRIPIVGHFIQPLVSRILRRIINLLAVMDKDTGSLFLTMEDCMREPENPLLDGRVLNIGGNKYNRLVLTPLMMDFGSKAIRTMDFEQDNIKKSLRIHYGKSTGKPILGQVIDVFNGIKKYKEATPSSELREKYESLTLNTNRILEIYPFLGINTRNYDMPRIEKMLKKYFDDYECSRNDLSKNMGQFDGNIDHIKHNFFAGIKVYPPLRFDPWPESEDEQKKVSYLYSYCCKKDIPITSHASEGGFVVVEETKLKNYTKISKWGEVLEYFPTLKLNLAHLPMREKILMIFPNRKHPRLNAMLELVLNYENVYVDISNRAINDKYYKSLGKVINNLPDKKKEKLINRILFGSDFAVNLMLIESYNKYLDIFSKTKYLTQAEKHSFCCINPERFLFARTKQ